MACGSNICQILSNYRARLSSIGRDDIRRYFSSTLVVLLCLKKKNKTLKFRHQLPADIYVGTAVCKADKNFLRCEGKFGAPKVLPSRFSSELCYSLKTFRKVEFVEAKSCRVFIIVLFKIFIFIEEQCSGHLFS